jgi:hypothetical protein
MFVNVAYSLKMLTNNLSKTVKTDENYVDTILALADPASSWRNRSAILNLFLNSPQSYGYTVGPHEPTRDGI